MKIKTPTIHYSEPQWTYCLRGRPKNLVVSANRASVTCADCLDELPIDDRAGDVLKSMEGAERGVL